MQTIIRVGVDIAKNVLQVHAVDAQGKVVTNRAIQRSKFLAWCAQLPAGCLVAMEACGGAHHWCIQHECASTCVGELCRASLTTILTIYIFLQKCSVSFFKKPILGITQFRFFERLLCGIYWQFWRCKISAG